jgi:hypothetical protein
MFHPLHALQDLNPPHPRWVRMFFLSLSAVVFLHGSGFGWIYPEHRDIMARAIHRLDPHRQTLLCSLWVEARRGHELRLSISPVDSPALGGPVTIDLASWPAIAGDHSTSAADMIHNALDTDWILEVAAVAKRLDARLSRAGLERHARTNALRDADLTLLRVDPQYATRAGANNVHFLLARPDPGISADVYVDTCLSPGCELNALGTYAWYHVSALQKADRHARGDLPDSLKGRLALAALADEAFAIHFLQDVFAAGHVAGTRGDASLRKGTHDYYNEYGLEVKTWDRRSMVIKGDAWMRPQDAGWTASAVQASLEQFLAAAEGRDPFLAPGTQGLQLIGPDTLNVATLEAMPPSRFPGGVGALLEQIIRTTPVPGLSEGDGELPRFRSEIGPFIGIVPALRGGLCSGGFEESQTTGGAIGGLEVAVRAGLGLDGVMNESGDGLVFLDLGFRLDAASSISLGRSPGLQEFGSILAAIPARPAFTSRIRVPFWLVPLDLLLAAPFLATMSPESFTRMAAVAGNGGLIPWQAGIATSVGRFQFVLGREIAVAFYGYIKGEDRFLFPYGGAAEELLALVSLRSVQLEFPVVEYMPFRTFATNQSSSLVLQMFGAVDIPTKTTVVYSPGGGEVATKSVWQIGLRAAFRWRNYW